MTAQKQNCVVEYLFANFANANYNLFSMVAHQTSEDKENSDDFKDTGQDLVGKAR